MATAQVRLNAVSPSMVSKAKATGKADMSFSDMLNKENKVSADRGNSKETKTNNIVSEKYSKENDKSSSLTGDNAKPNKANDKISSSKEDTSYKAKDSTYQADKDAVKRLFAEEPEADDEWQDEKVKNLMAILASMIADISRKTGTDEAAVKDFIVENNLTSENLLDINSWKGFVTEINGLDNISAILTNNEAFEELSDISEIINIHLDEMGQKAAGMTEGATDDRQAEDLAMPEKEVLSLSELIAKLFEKPKREELVVTREEVDVEETVEKDAEEPLVITPLIANENGAKYAETQAGFEQNGRNSGGEKQGASIEVTGVSSQNLFDNIAANIQKLEGTDSLPEGTTAKAILEQVTNQIRGLHAPDKTSLEFMLTPETLGKVAVNVSSKRGVLHAEFRVESAEAKIALESRMAELKLNFENQGLKVESVSVMISKNGIGRDDQGKNTGEEGKRGNKKNRNFAIDGDDGLESISVSTEDAIIAYTDNGTGSNINLGA